MSTATTVFNQYYFDVLKKIRDIARKRKQTDQNARRILKAIKENYLSWDRLSDEYQRWFAERDWSGYLVLENEGLDEWSKGAGADLLVYKGISVKSLYQILKESATLHHFLTVLCLFKEGTEGLEELLAAVKAPTVEAENFLIRRLAYLETLRASASAGAAGGMLQEIENTTIGKLAKEIMSEINIDEIQGMMSDNGGDILKTLAAPNNGIVNLLSTVSQKMISKMANGELRQETLLEDAMKFASGAMGNGAAGGLAGLMSAMGLGSSRSRRRRAAKKAARAMGENINTNVEA